MLGSNKSNFEKKIHGATFQIKEAVESSKDAILRQLNEGPHEALDDEDIKVIWSESVRISFRKAIRTSGLYPFNRNGETASSGMYLLMRYMTDSLKSLESTFARTRTITKISGCLWSCQRSCVYQFHSALVN
ncbi:cellulose expressed protein 6 [Heterobasidion irregulare TC 32-1]|uniref:Cellulose expressed protein 6 n=1 Tax=Heterobasidion irregulare (strain TC 32-1) TaxID=747525 RepID=W4JW87_HETIT|nr:cellulose expressed protein 6 [Heterobasidion irregulare TC 32-1]ETW77797.1 cellulose expressed protein 6 [Heterobasidion irregulare TC 32-1]